ncbi:cytosolic iron-sulfur assembly component 2A-like [Tigriopus californicus]|uniref:cytosolic iron-sulfur assembly component 2A-like n=1 Tax=Tigriopus californicus TaxID=6832 RepID=UPI0027D9DF6F|nr:cytosolic iron-sulfur assembly component 2A-like [Tigriopus californicus]
MSSPLASGHPPTSLAASTPSHQGIAPLDPSEETSSARECREWQETVYDLLQDIRDPEKPESLSDLDVVRPELIQVRKLGPHLFHASIGFVPTVSHCSLATLIGLCLRIKLVRNLPARTFKLHFFIQPGSHETAAEITKQINDKERVCAAMENPHLKRTVDECLLETY